MSHCVKTGAQVFLQALGVTVSADIYAVGSAALVIRWTLGSEREVPTRMDHFNGQDVYIPVDPATYTHIAYQANFDKGDWVRDDLGVAVVMRSHLSGEIQDGY